MLPYPKNEPRRRKLGMVATVRKTSAGPRPAISASGLPQRVVRKGGLWDVDKLEARLWSRDRKRELAEAQAAATKANVAMKHRKEKRNARKEAKKAGVTTTAPAAATPTKEGSSVQAVAAQKSSLAETAAAKAAAAGGDTKATPITNSTTGVTAEAGAAEDAQPKARSRKRKLVSPMAFMQKKWLERRRTKVLHLDPQSYAYAESNAAIGRLVSRTMYTAPWKLGGRKARFRSRRQKREQRIAQIKENRAFVAREKERERIAEDKARQRKLEKQRARGAGKAAAASKAEQVEEGGEVKKVEGAGVGESKAGEKAAEVVKPTEASKPTEANKPVEASKPAEDSKPAEADKPTET